MPSGRDAVRRFSSGNPGFYEHLGASAWGVYDDGGTMVGLHIARPATGKRKNAVARVRIKPGHGKIIVNDKDFSAYFARPVLQMLLKQPLVLVGRDTQYDIHVTVAGGGLSGQAGAVRHGISKALTYYEPALRPALKAGGFLTRDARVVERKKYGRKKARRSFQFSKR